jgi:hypothetical protein
MVTRQHEAPLDFARLKEKQRSIRGDFPESLTLRVHRAISWLGRAEREADDADVRFILLWIGFNSAYGSDVSSTINSERGTFKTYFDWLVRLDVGQRIYGVVWKRFPHEVRLLLGNKYIFAPFWNHHNGLEGYSDWEERLAASQRAIASTLAQQDTSRILAIVFDRLYVLRNQLVHGGATWNSGINRDQVRDGAGVIGWLLPIFIDIMMDNPQQEWGPVAYPVVE